MRMSHLSRYFSIIDTECLVLVLIKTMFQDVNNFILGLEEQQKIVSTVEYAKEKYFDLKSDYSKEIQLSEKEIELMIVKIDHMRKSGPYLKTLENWSNQFALTSLFVISKDQGLILLVEGDKCNISKFLLQWKTTNIDVDSHGKPCKEKMMQILLREKHGNSDYYLKEITKECFTVIECDHLIQYFGQSKISSTIKSIFQFNKL